jgi:hypothetical protein
VDPDDGGPSNDIPLNGRARLTLEVSNPNDLVALENVTLETRFDNNGALIVANSPDVNGTCSGANFDPGVNQLSGSTSFVVSGFNLPIGDSCTIELDIKGVEVADNVQIQAINISAGNTNEVGESARRFVNIMPPHELRIVRGSGQAIEIGLRFPISLVTEVVDEFGRPIREVTVSYENDGGGNNPPIGLSEDGNVDVSDFDDLAGEIDGVETGSDNITTPIYAYAVRDPGSHRIIAFVEGYEEVVETAFFLENLPD